MPTINYEKDGQTWYTHSSWLSLRQKRAYYSIEEQNSNLCCYYTMGALALSAIFSRKVALIGTFYRSVGVYTGAAVLTGSSFLVCKLIMSQRTPGEMQSVVDENDSLHTPLWNDPGKVKRLRVQNQLENDVPMLEVRAKGDWNTQAQLMKYNPDLILTHPDAKEMVDKANVYLDVMKFPLIQS